MPSTFTGIEMGKRGLDAHNRGLSTVGHNLSNASKEGYSRQRVRMETMDPLYMPQLNREERAGQIGQGTQVQSIERVRDNLLEQRIVAQGEKAAYWSARDKYVLMMEEVYNEPGESSVRSMMDRFWEGWQELSAHPEQMAARQAVLRRGQALMEGINQRFESLKEIRTMTDDDLRVTVNQVNNLSSDIAGLNEQILKAEAVGDNPNDLYDRRDLLVERLSKKVNITVENRRDPDEFQVHTGGRHLVQGKLTQELEAVPNPGNEGYHDIVWAGTDEQADLRGGKLAALVEVRDQDLRGEIQKLDNMTLTFTDLVNEIHTSGSGRNDRSGVNFFSEYPFVNNLAGNYDRTGDGEYDSSYIYRITGTNGLEPKDQIGLQGTMTLPSAGGTVDVAYNPADTVEDVVERINNSASEVSARLDRQGRLTFQGMPASDQGNPDFVIRSLEDDGQFLAGYAGVLNETGPEGAYTWEEPDAVLALAEGGVDYSVAPLSHPSGWMRVNPEIASDPASIAAGYVENGRPAPEGDGSAALDIAQLRNKPVMIGKITTFDDFYAETVAEVGLKGEIAKTSLETQEQIMKDMTDLRQSISGVNIDEEMSQMIKFQHGYSAVARFVTEVDKMLDTIINRMGV